MYKVLIPSIRSKSQYSKIDTYSLQRDSPVLIPSIRSKSQYQWWDKKNGNAYFGLNPFYQV